MKKISIVLLVLISVLFLFTTVFAADVWVNGYHRSDGTYVRGHYRSAPDSNPWNNYSTKGNTNPYTGKPGYLDPNRSYSPDPFKYNSPFKSKSYNNNLWDD